MRGGKLIEEGGFKSSRNEMKRETCCTGAAAFMDQ